MAVQWRRPGAVGRLPALSGSRSGSGGAGEDWFDRWAYRAAVELATPTTRQMPPPPNPVGIPTLALDEDVTWCAQWGKVDDLTFRFYTGTMPTTVDVPAHMQWATIAGIGITMSGYRQPISMMSGTLGAVETQGQLFPFEIAMINDGDYRQGYVLENMTGFQLPQGKAFFFKGNEQLITRTYFKDGQLTYDADDFRTGGV